MLCVPAARLLVLQAAVFVSPLPESATAVQPLIALPPSVKATMPVGARPVTVAVNITLAPTVEGLRELDKAVLLVALLTTCDSAALAELLLAPSPP